jgi:hypothetical protein
LSQVPLLHRGPDRQKRRRKWVHRCEKGGWVRTSNQRSIEERWRADVRWEPGWMPSQLDSESGTLSLSALLCRTVTRDRETRDADSSKVLARMWMRMRYERCE